jgi:2'-5' RNA ligase
MDRDNLHLTLAFLGHLPAARRDDAVAVAESIAAARFDLCLDRLGYWKHNRILWAGGESAHLEALAGELASRLRTAGFLLESRPFAAHLTLLRDARCPAVPQLPEPVGWPVREFVLAESTASPRGPVYRPVGRWPLG